MQAGIFFLDQTLHFSGIAISRVTLSFASLILGPWKETSDQYHKDLVNIWEHTQINIILVSWKGMKMYHESYCY